RDPHGGHRRERLGARHLCQPVTRGLPAASAGACPGLTGTRSAGPGGTTGGVAAGVGGNFDGGGGGGPRPRPAPRSGAGFDDEQPARERTIATKRVGRTAVPRGVDVLARPALSPLLAGG